MATRDEINEAVRLMLQNVTEKNIGLAEIPPWPDDTDEPPDNWPGKSYGILWPQNTSTEGGSMQDGEEERDMIFQVTCVGDDPRRAGLMSSKVESAFLALKPGGGYLHDIPLVGHAVTIRTLDSQGSIVPNGEDHFASADSYRLRVCRTP